MADLANRFFGNSSFTYTSLNHPTNEEVTFSTMYTDTLIFFGLTYKVTTILLADGDLMYVVTSNEAK